MQGDVTLRPVTQLPVDVVVLHSALRGRGWITADAVNSLTGWSERKVRQVAQDSQGTVLGGQLGYRMTSEASSEEVAHVVRFLRSQAVKMLDRARDIESASTRETGRLF
jgi:hypothetical protein